LTNTALKKTFAKKAESKNETTIAVVNPDEQCKLPFSNEFKNE
jgi:hypothetical protein